MIEIDITHLNVSVRGHAGSAKAGEYDMVCAGISALTHTLCHALSELAPDTSTWYEGKGNADIAVHSPSKSTCLLINAFYIGVTEIAKTYPQYVHIKSKPCRL